MKKYLLRTAAFGLVVVAGPAWAACGVSNLQVKDNAAVTASVPYGDDGSGGSNCSPQIQIKQGGNVANVDAGHSLQMAGEGTAGSAAGGVVTVQGVASMTALLVNPGTAANWNTTWAGGTLGSMANYGTSPGAVLVPGVNAFVTNTPTVSVPTWAGGTLGAMANYGTSPGAVLVPGVNAFITNANANGVATAANSSPVVNALDLVNSTTGNIAANNTTAVVVNAAATTVYSIQLGGIGSAPAYLKLYNATSATCGSGTPVKRLIIPAASTAANGAGSNIVFPLGLRFSTGLTYCITTGITDADTTAPAASTFLVNIDWH